MNRSITLCLALIALLISNQRLSAQDFVWGRSGGSPMPTQGADDETIVDMACDKNGNIYILSQVMGTGIQIAGQPVTGYGANDVMLASFTPKGVLRWYKIIGNGDVDRCQWLGVDDKDGVYCSIFSNQSNNPVNISTDAVTQKNFQRCMLVKYDTAGKYQWHRQPEATTLSSWAANTTIAMDAGASGTTYWLMRLTPGTYANGALTVPTAGTYLLKYSASGAFSYVKPDIDVSGIVHLALKADETNGRFYISGYNNEGTVAIKGNTVPYSALIGCFKTDGSYLWHKNNTIGIGIFNAKAAIDNSGNIYLTGWGAPAGTVTPPRPDFNFNGFIVKNGDGSTTPILIKLDKNGNLIWGRDANVDGASSSSAVAIRNNNEVVIAGDYPKKIEWPGFPHAVFSNPPNYGYDMFVARFDSQNGNVLDMDRIQSNAGYNEYPNRMASDGKGNVYIGGEFTSYMYVNQAETLANAAGGQTDWFLLKYTDRFPVSVQQNNSSIDVKIYPNPAMAQLIIDGIAAGTYIHVMNMLGQQVLPPVVSKESKEIISTESLLPGSYLLQLTYPDGSNASYRVEKQ